ncbi:MAG: cation transporter [Flavobacteriales bacterium]
MKKNLLILVASSLIGLVMTTVSCDGEGAKTTKTEVSAENAAFLRLDIDGMTCPDGCAKPIEQMLSEAEGVSSAEVDFEKKAAFINYDKSVTSEEKLMKLVADYKDGAYTPAVSAHQCPKDCEKACCTKEACPADCTKPCCLAKKAKKVSNNAVKTAKKATQNAVNTAKKSTEDVIIRTKQDAKSTASKAAGKLNSTTTKVEKTAKDAIKSTEGKVIRTTQKATKSASRGAAKVKNTVNDTKKAVNTEIDKLKGSN